MGMMSLCNINLRIKVLSFNFLLIFKFSFGEYLDISLNDLLLNTDVNKTYFIQESKDLNSWISTDTYVLGDGGRKQFPLDFTEAQYFYRFISVPTNQINPEDLDGDGIYNGYEISMGLNPIQITSVTQLAIAEIDSRIALKTPYESLRIFNNYTLNGSNLIFERNANCWINNIENISCISPWNARNTRRRAGILITPKHVIFCAHYGFYVNSGHKIYFVNNESNVVERTIMKTMRHPQYSMPYASDNDIVLGVLDKAVPSTIKCVKFFPDDWYEYLENDVNVPSLRLNQHEEALVGNFYISSIKKERAYHLKPNDPQRLIFYLSLSAPEKSGLYIGDSGNGGFVIIDSQLILTNLWTFGGPGSGTSVTNEKNIINEMIVDLDNSLGEITGFEVQEFDFSKYIKLKDIPLEYRLVGQSEPPIIQASSYPLLIEEE